MKDGEPDVPARQVDVDPFFNAGAKPEREDERTRESKSLI
jgi:hypothetical protein